MKNLLRYLATTAVVTLALLFGASPAQAGTFIVTTRANSGPGSLRQAITDANADPGAATINIQAGLGTITLASELPILKNPAGLAGLRSGE